MDVAFEALLMRHQLDCHPLLPLPPGITVAMLNLSVSNKQFLPENYSSTEALTKFIQQQFATSGAQYLMGGYREHREMYRRSALFNVSLEKFNDSGDEPRSIHLGLDIWAEAGTPVYAPLGGMLHSFADNSGYGDYGATIILQHQLETENFYTLYGHLSLQSIEALETGRFITRGQRLATLGHPEENGNWPPHLHFQIITDMLQFEGNFPGVCKPSEAAKYFNLCPDPELLLGMKRFLTS